MGYIVRAHLALAHLQGLSGQIDEALDRCRIAISLAKELGDLNAEHSALLRLSHIQRYRGPYEVALATAQESLLLARAGGKLFGETMSLLAQATMHMEGGQYVQASMLAREAESLCFSLALGPETRTHRELVSMQAEIHLRKTEYNDARRLNLSILKTNQEFWMDPAAPYALLNIALIDIMTDKHTDSSVRENLDSVRKVFSVADNKMGLAACECTDGDLHLKLGQHDIAQEHYLLSLVMARGHFSEIEMNCLERLSDIKCRQDNTTDFLRYSVLFLVHAGKLKDRRSQALARLGDVFLRRNDEETALTLLEIALEGFIYMDIHCDRGDCMVKIGDIMQRRGDVAVAQKLWKSARIAFLRSSQDRKVESCDERLSAIFPSQ